MERNSGSFGLNGEKSKHLQRIAEDFVKERLIAISYFEVCPLNFMVLLRDHARRTRQHRNPMPKRRGPPARRKRAKKQCKYMCIATRQRLLLRAFQVPSENDISPANAEINAKIALLRTKYTCHADDGSDFCWVSPEDGKHVALGHPHFSMWAAAWVPSSFIVAINPHQC
jgi:hypothetical protein